jgi:hypothetical protein
MKLISKSSVVQFDECVEPRDSKVTGPPRSPFVVERKETSEGITWYGVTTNWFMRATDFEWTETIHDMHGIRYEVCAPPLYEAEYQKALHPFELVNEE